MLAETLADKTKYALEYILWYNDYLDYENNDEGLFEKVNPYCFCNILWNIADFFIDKEKEIGKPQSFTQDELDYYVEMVCNKCGVVRTFGKIGSWNSEEHTIWMLLVGMFGDWGTSIRSGWISEFNECKEWLEEMLKRDVGEVYNPDGTEVEQNIHYEKLDIEYK